MDLSVPTPVVARTRTGLTREGQVWLLVSIVLWLVGWLKGINLILLLANLLLLLWVLNWAAAPRALRGLSARRVVRGPVFAGLPVTMQVDVSFSGGQTLSGCEVVDEGPQHAVRWFLSKAAGEVRLRREVIIPGRGRYECRPVRAVSSFPFGLVRREVEFGSGQALTVLPRLGRLHVGRLRRWLTHSARPDERTRRSHRRLALEAEFHGLRQFRAGDSPRWIHWRTSARTGELVVREFDHGTHFDLAVVVEPFAVGDSSPAVEAAISLAATVCWSWAREAGDRVFLAIAGKKPVVLTGGDSPGAVVELLEALALTPCTPATDAASLGRQLLELPLPAGPALLISSRPQSGTAAELSRRLGRPVAQLDATRPPAFYQPPI